MKQSKAQTGEKTKVDQELLDMNLDPYEGTIFEQCCFSNAFL